MHRNVNWIIALPAVCVWLSGVASTSCAKSIVKMSLGASTSGNMQFSSGVFSMLDDGLANTLGDRNVTIDSVDVGPRSISALASNGEASLTLSGMVASASPSNTGSFIIQSFNSGNLAIYNPDSSLLLSADLSLSAIQGALGPSDAQALFLGFGEVTGGTLAPYLDPDSLQVRIKYPTISGGFALSSSPNSQLNSFTTSTLTVEIMAVVPIPEPSVSLSLGALAWALATVRRRRRR